MIQCHRLDHQAETLKREKLRIFNNIEGVSYSREFNIVERIVLLDFLRRRASNNKEARLQLLASSFIHLANASRTIALPHAEKLSSALPMPSFGHHGS